MKRILFFVIAVLLTLILGACGVTSTSEHNYEKDVPLKVTGHNTRWIRTAIVTDEQTGVNYIVIMYDEGVTITPRYKTDGSLVISR